jgi:hypothetical protein
MSFTKHKGLSDELLKVAQNMLEGKLEKDADDPCWDGYVQVGMKKNDKGEEVPNCVPMNEAFELPEGLAKEDQSDFVVAAAAAKKAGKKKFTFKGKEFPVTIKADIPTEEVAEEFKTCAGCKTEEKCMAESKCMGKSESKDKKVKNEIEINPELEEAVGGMASAASELEAYAKKNGGIDKGDFMKAVVMMKKGKKKELMKFVDDLDTEPREKILSVMDKHLKEEVELDEAVDAKKVIAHLVKKGNNPKEAEAMVKKELAGAMKAYPNAPVAKIAEYIRSVAEGVELDEALNKKDIANAIQIAMDNEGAMTKAVKMIEKIKKGLSKHKDVVAALRMANEEVENFDASLDEAIEEATINTADVEKMKNISDKDKKTLAKIAALMAAERKAKK